MNKETLATLAGISDVDALRNAVEQLCVSYGRVRDIHMLSNNRGEEYLCFVTFESHELNPRVIEALGGISYGSSVAFRIPFSSVLGARGQRSP